MFQVDSQMYRTPDGNVVQFWERPVPHKVASENAGRPIFFKAVMARIISPAMKTQAPDQRIYLKDDQGNIVRRNVRYVNADTGQMEHWDDYLREPLKAWMDGKASAGNGTPLESYPRLDVAQIAMLKQLGIHFLEQLAVVADAQIHQFGPGGRSMRDGAKAYLDAAEGNAPMEKLNAKNAELEARLAAMAEQMERITANQTERKKPGPKPRNLEAA